MPHMIELIHEIVVPVGIIALVGLNYITNLRLKEAEDGIRVIRDLVCLRKNERVVYEEEE